MRITRKKALVIAEDACRRYERKTGDVPGGMTITLPQDYSTSSESQWPYDVVTTADGTFISPKVPWPIGMPYHHNTSWKTWLR